MSNLALGSEIENRTVRCRYVRHTFPGALPYVLDSDGFGKSYHPTREEAVLATWTSEWSDFKSVVDDGSLLATCGGWSIRYGREDWPAPEVAQRVVLVGELNPYQDRQDFDLYDLPERASGHRLRELILGVSREDYFRRFCRRNLCVGKWSAPAARKRASELCAEFPTQTFVLLGKKMQEAFGITDERQLSSSRGLLNEGGKRWRVFLPHPSGLCRVWNEPGAFERARDALRSAGVFCAEKG